VDEVDHHCAFADRGSDSFDRPVPHVAREERPRVARLEEVRFSPERPRRLPAIIVQQVRPGDEKAVLVALSQPLAHFEVGSPPIRMKSASAGSSCASPLLVSTTTIRSSSRSGLSSREAADELWQQAEASLLAVPSA
jgi:hypothetical protein